VPAEEALALLAERTGVSEFLDAQVILGDVGTRGPASALIDTAGAHGPRSCRRRTRSASFPAAGVQMTADLLADLEQRARLTRKLAARNSAAQ
jgi:hypothetical protein